jgi:SNF2 family DNA or RNA helicase
MNDFHNNYTKIYSEHIVLHKDIEDDNILLIPGSYRTLYIIDKSDIPPQHRSQLRYGTNMYAKTVYFLKNNKLRLYWYSIENITYPYLHFKTREEISQETIKIVKDYNEYIYNNFNKNSLCIKLEKDTNDNYLINYYFKTSIIDSILAGKKKYQEVVLYDFITLTKKEINHAECISVLQNINSPCKNNSLLNNNNREFIIDSDILKPEVTLFNYQINDIIWMKSIQDNIKSKTNTFTHQFDKKIMLLDDKFVLLGNQIYPSWIMQHTNIKEELIIKYYGGNIISEVGLGKTIVSLYHIFINSKSNKHHFNNFIKFSSNCNYIYKRGSRKGHSCLNNVSNTSNSSKSKLYCKEHQNYLFVEKRVLEYKNLNQFNTLDFISANGLIKTNASLVICPNQLCDQWVREYYDKFVNDKHVVLIVTRDQFNNIKLSDILFADLVIISYQFLTNIEYFKNIQYNSISNTSQKLGYIIKHFNTDNKTVEELLNSSLFNSPHLFDWHSVFLDEAHEIFNMQKYNIIKHIIKNICSQYKWNITGTPFANGINGFLSLINYNTYMIENTTGTYRSSNSSSHSFSILDQTNLNTSNGLNKQFILLFKDLFRCNTKESIADDFSGNIINNTIHMLEFTDQERNLYDSYIAGGKSKYSNFIIQLCCHPDLHDDTKKLIKNCKTLDEIQTTILDYNNTQLKREHSILKKTMTEIRELEIKIIDATERQDEIEYETLKSELSILKRKYTTTNTKYENIKRTYTYLENAIKSLKDKDKTCPICLDVIPDNNMSITSCGHEFCFDCISVLYSKITEDRVRIQYSDKFKCPSCNKLINSDEVYLIQPTVNDKNSADLELDDIIKNVRSTKIGNIVYYIKNNLQRDDKIIIFSQWDELLHKVGDIIEQYGIKLVYCNGTVYQKRRAIDSFYNNSDTNVIMLSSRNAASGINLTIANKIILLEPIYGSKDYRKSIEEQAIGRADRIGQSRPIEVLRFIIKNTIEEDIINDNIDDSKLKQLTIT